ncbi:MAG: NTP transferase domain-containing protein [Alphaproteobacteria bacterium]
MITQGTQGEGGVSVWIPARLASERLAGKMLLEVGGVSLIERVWRLAVEARVGEVFVAAGDAEIVRLIEEAGGRAILTDPSLPSGSDRVWAAADSLGDALTSEWLINLQGDMPFFPPSYLRRLARCLSTSAADGVDAVTLCAPLEDARSREDAAVVKAAVVFNGDAGTAGGAGGESELVPVTYFSRGPVPWTGADGTLPLWGHIGIYAWRRSSLRRFVLLPSSALERRERLEQLRALEAGMRMAALLVDTMPEAIDTAEDLERVRRSLD